MDLCLSLYDQGRSQGAEEVRCSSDGSPSRKPWMRSLFLFYPALMDAVCFQPKADYDEWIQETAQSYSAKN